jgi:hypothetical protein
MGETGTESGDILPLFANPLLLLQNPILADLNFARGVHFWIRVLGGETEHVSVDEKHLFSSRFYRWCHS